MQKLLLLLAGSALLCAVPAVAQDDAPSLGSVARQSRLQKQQKDAQAKDASAKTPATKDAPGSDPNAKDTPAPKSPHVITNEELPHVGLTMVSTEVTETPRASDAPPVSGNKEAQAEQWKSQIQSQKSAIASLQHEIDSVSESIHYTGGSCVANCAQWNERQKQKQDQVESMKAQLAEQQKRLEDMQESARKQGFGSAVYEP